MSGSTFRNLTVFIRTLFTAHRFACCTHTLVLVLASMLCAATPLNAQAASTTAVESSTTPTLTVSLLGAVVDRLTSTPIQGAFIQLEGRSRLSTETLTGRFEFTELLPGHYSITAYADFYTSSIVALDAAAGGRIGPIIIKLTPRSGISGFVVDSQGIAITGATVTAAFQGRWDFRPRREAGPGTQTDSNGNFFIEDIEPGRVFRLIATHEQYAHSEAGPFKLLPGQREEGVKIVLEGGGRLEGAVVDEENNPIEGATAAVLRSEGNMRDLPAIARIFAATLGTDARVETGSDGAFSFPHLAPGRYTVFARKDGFIYDYKDGLDIAGDQIIKDIRLTLKKGVAIKGLVKNSQDEPVAGARVSAMRFDMRNPIRDQAVSDEEGRFELNSLLPGRYNVMVEADEYPRLVEQNVEAPNENLVLTLNNGGTLTGHVISKSDESPITEFSVELTTRGGRGQGGFGFAGPGQGGPFGPGGQGNMRKSIEDPDGAFEFQHISEGIYTLRVRAKGYAPATKSGVRIREDETTDVTIEMTNGLVLTGRVLTARLKEPVGGATVDLLEMSEGMAGLRGGGGRFGGRQGGGAVASAETDALGQFRIDELMPGRFQLRVQAEGYSEYTEQIVITAQEDNDITVYISAGGAVTGRIVAGEQHQPVQGASVTIADGGGGWVGRFIGVGTDGAISAMDGNFVLTPVPAGKVTLRVSHPQYSSVTLTDIVVSSDETVNLGDIVLTGGGGIEGVVTRGENQPVAGAFLTATGPAGFRTAQTDETGAFRWTGLEAGDYSVTITRLPEGGEFRFSQQARKNVTVKDGENTRCDFQLTGGYRLSGVVTYSGQAVAGRRVSYSLISGTSTETSARSASTETNDSGEFSFEDLPDGQYVVTVSRRGGGRWMASPVAEKTIEIAGNDVDITLVIPEARVAGVVLDAESNQPIDDVTLTIVPDSASVTSDDIMGGRLGAFRQTRSNDSGAFEFNNITEGSWTIIAQHPEYSYSVQSIDVQEGEDMEGVQLSLTAGLSLTITALARSTGAPVGSLYLQIFDSSGTMIREGQYPVDSLGQCLVSGLREGSVGLSAFAPNYAPLLRVQTSVMPNTDNQARLEFEDGGSLILHVTNEAGQPVSNAAVQLAGPGGWIISYPIRFSNQVAYSLSTITNSEGRLKHDHLPPGILTVTITAPGAANLAPATEQVQITNGSTAELSVTLKPR